MVALMMANLLMVQARRFQGSARLFTGQTAPIQLT